MSENSQNINFYACLSENGPKHDASGKACCHGAVLKFRLKCPNGQKMCFCQKAPLQVSMG